jgi:hypothetical protein
MRADEPRDIAFRRIILSIPPGKVSTYGRVATAKFQRLEGRIDVGSLPQRQDGRSALHWRPRIAIGETLATLSRVYVGGFSLRICPPGLRRLVNPLITIAYG